MTDRDSDRQFLESPWPNGRAFCLFLSHDVDRVRKTYQYVTHLRKKRGLLQLGSIFTGNPYWNFLRITELEHELGVRSTFYFLRETKRTSLLRPRTWAQTLGKYRFDQPDIASVIQELDRGGWEVGLHGSLESYHDIELLRREKSGLEDVLGHSVQGIRQHYLNLDKPKTWEYQRAAGFQYDASLGKRDGIGYGGVPLFPFAPLGDGFIELPLVVMDGALLAQAATTDERTRRISEIVQFAEKQHALLSILWHQRFINPYEFPLETHLYRTTVEAALRRKPWVATGRQVADWWRTRIGR